MYIIQSPCVRIKRPEVAPHESTIYSAEDLYRLIDGLREQQHPILIPIMLCVFCGLRRGAALGLRWCDVNPETGELRIRGNLTSFYDDGREMTIYKGVKTKASDSTVIAPAELIEELKRLRERRFADGLLQYPDDTAVDGQNIAKNLDFRAFVCLDEHSRLFRPQGLRSRLQNYQRANALPVCTVHDLRHTYGTLLTESGVDIAVVSKALRHSSVKITADTYVSASTAIKKKATQTMAEVIALGGGENCAKIVPGLFRLCPEVPEKA